MMLRIAGAAARPATGGIPMLSSRALGLLALSVVMAATPALGAPPANAEQEIGALEKSFNAAYAVNDLPKYFSYYADDLVAIFPDGRTTLATYRKEWGEYIKAGNHLTANTLSDLTIRVSPAGDEATAYYEVAVRTKLATGKFTDERFQETDIWLKRDGKWQVAYVHYSPAPAPKKP
jgi:ketosteroid isomerase-like protein